MTVEELMIVYIRERLPVNSPSTIAMDEQALRAIRLSGLGRVFVDRLTGNDTLQLAHRQWVVLRRCYDWALQNGRAKANPCRTVKAPKPGPSLRKRASVDQYLKTPEERFEALMGRKVEPTGISISQERARLIARFVLATGCRRGEVCALRLDDVDWTNKTVRITKAVIYAGNKTVERGTKTVAGDRLIALPDSIMDELIQLRDKSIGKKYLFETLHGNRLHPVNLSQTVKTYLEGVGLGEFSLHTLRHVHASKLVEAGLAINVVARRLGHSDPTVTTRIYVHPTQKQDREAAAAIGALL